MDFPAEFWVAVTGVGAAVSSAVTTIVKNKVVRSQRERIVELENQRAEDLARSTKQDKAWRAQLAACEDRCRECPNKPAADARGPQTDRGES